MSSDVPAATISRRASLLMILFLTQAILSR